MIERDAGLPARLAGRRVLVTGDGAIARALRERLEGCGCGVQSARSPAAAALPASVDAALVSLQSLAAAPVEVAAQIFEIATLLQGAPGLRHVLVIVPTTGGPSVGPLAVRLARTLAIYATVHTAEADVRINVLTIPARPDDETIVRVGDVCLVLVSGLLDAVRGQTLAIDDVNPMEAHS